LTDLLYRTVALTDGSKTIQEVYDTDAYGNTLAFDTAGGGGWFGDDDAATTAPACPYLFTGRRYDPETEIYYYRARYYHPEMGRFVSKDPEQRPKGMGIYAYASGIPTGRLDPTGTSDNHYRRRDELQRKRDDLELRRDEALEHNDKATADAFDGQIEEVNAQLDIVERNIDPIGKRQEEEAKWEWEKKRQEREAERERKRAQEKKQFCGNIEQNYHLCWIAVADAYAECISMCHYTYVVGGALVGLASGKGRGIKVFGRKIGLGPLVGAATYFVCSQMCTISKNCADKHCDRVKNWCKSAKTKCRPSLAWDCGIFGPEMWGKRKKKGT
jgi:RHS repeat-associated protein